MNDKSREFLDKLRNTLAKVDFKIYLYAAGAIAVIILIIMNVNEVSKYGATKNDGKFYLNIDKIANDYGLDLSSTDQPIDYVNNSDANLTNDLAKSLFTTTVFLDQSNLNNSDAKGKILANVVLEYQKQAKGKVYTESDLYMVRGTDKAALTEYYNDLGDAITAYTQNLKNTSLLSSSSNTQNPSEGDLIQMKAVITANTLRTVDVNNQFIDKLLSIPATTDGAVYQLQLINSISEQNAFLKSLAYIDTDPMKYIMLDGDNYKLKMGADLNSILTSFNNYFKQNGVTIN